MLYALVWDVATRFLREEAVDVTVEATFLRLSKNWGQRTCKLVDGVAVKLSRKALSACLYDTALLRTVEKHTTRPLVSAVTGGLVGIVLFNKS